MEQIQDEKSYQGERKLKIINIIYVKFLFYNKNKNIKIDKWKKQLSLNV